jgi:intracellular septation protein
MKLLYDLLPIFAFFVAFKFFGIFVATGIAILAVLFQLGMTYVQGKKPDLMQWITLAMVVLLGGSTLIFRNEMFIKWKPTAVYWVLALVFAISDLILKKNLVKAMLQKSLTLPNKAWSTLNFTWYTFFFIMGALNLFVIYTFDTPTWVNFKLFGTLILTLGFALFQAFLVSRYLPSTPQEKELP